jgi:hypothetical protein
VGICPAFSCASRAALSPASWVAFSLEWNVPLGVAAAVELLLDDAAPVLGVVVAAFEELPVKRAAPSAPPMRVEPTIAKPTTALRMGFMS